MRVKDQDRSVGSVLIRLERLLDGCCVAVMPLGLLVLLLLWAQWPLRDLVGVGSIQANDLAQWLFALYIAVAVRHAERRSTHLVAHPQAARSLRWKRRGTALCVLPWSLYLLWCASGPVWRSVSSLERFPESLNQGYFMIKLAAWLMALLLCLQSLVDLTGNERTA